MPQTHIIVVTIAIPSLITFLYFSNFSLLECKIFITFSLFILHLYSPGIPYSSFMSIFCTLSSLMNIFAFGNALHRLSTSVSSFDKGVSYMHIVSRFFSDFRSSASFIWLSCKSISTIFLQLFKKLKSVVSL